MIESRLAEIMEEKGITVLALSNEAGVATETITRARGNKIGQCRLDTLEKIAGVLQVSIKDLFEERG
jgi:DNA-binding Xre family transcriptional regulator